MYHEILKIILYAVLIGMAIAFIYMMFKNNTDQKLAGVREIGSRDVSIMLASRNASS